MYYSNNNNIKYIGSIIKCKNFESDHYTINLCVISSFMVLNGFNYLFLFKKEFLYKNYFTNNFIEF